MPLPVLAGHVGENWSISRNNFSLLLILFDKCVHIVSLILQQPLPPALLAPAPLPALSPPLQVLHPADPALAWPASPRSPGPDLGSEDDRQQQWGQARRLLICLLSEVQMNHPCPFNIPPSSPFLITDILNMEHFIDDIEAVFLFISHLFLVK